jgi:hypothetical protein
MASITTLEQALLLTKIGLLMSISAPDTKLSRYYNRPEAQESVSREVCRKLRVPLTWSVHEVPSSGLFREVGDFPNISQVMKKPIPIIYDMFRNFEAIAYSLHNLLPCKP